MLQACGVMLWQTSIFMLVLCHLLAIRALWCLIGRTVRWRYLGSGACLGLMVMMLLRGGWRVQAAQMIVAETSDARFFWWSAVGFLLTLIVALDLKRLFTRLQRRMHDP